MILRKVIYLRKSTDKDRLNMYKAANDKDFSHPDVVKISQQLDKKIVKMLKIMYSSSVR